jgi:hypothetical protein
MEWAMALNTVAAQIDSAADVWSTDGPFDMYPELRQVHARDASDLREVAQHVRSGRMQEARDRAAGLDTVVREELPDGFFRLLAEFRVAW